MDNTEPVWKKIYQAITIDSQRIQSKVLTDTLELCQIKIVKVLTEYKVYSKFSFDNWIKKTSIFTEEKDEAIRNFINRGAIELDVEVDMFWTLLCNYLTFEYYGKVDELKSIVKIESSIKTFIDNMWNFYTADRMFLLKTLRFILEKSHDRRHVYYRNFNKFIREIDLKELWKNLMETFDMLFVEIVKEKLLLNRDADVKRWTNRNNRELSEVVLLLTLTLDYYKCEGTELNAVLTRFLRHDFGRDPVSAASRYQAESRHIVQIQCAELGCLLKLAQISWENPTTMQPLPREIQRSLENGLPNSDYTVALFIWAVLKITLKEEAYDYCNDIMPQLLNNKIFQILDTMLSDPIYADCHVGRSVHEAAFVCFSEFTKISDERKYFFEQEGLTGLLVHFLKFPELNCMYVLKDFIQVAVDIFPFIPTPLLSICQQLINTPEFYDRGINLVENLPTLLLDVPWNSLAKEIVISNDSQIVFPHGNMIQLPINTISREYSIYNYSVTQYQVQYALYDVLEKYTNSLLNPRQIGVVNKHTVQDFVAGYEVILTILNHHEGDYLTDLPLRRCVTNLNFIIAHFSQGPDRHVELITVYFRIRCALFRNGLSDFDTAFPKVIQKRFFPQVSREDFTFKELFAGQVVFSSILFEALRDEEQLDRHVLLMEYMDLIYFAINKNIYYEEIQKNGLALLTFSFFPHHAQWKYKDPHEKTLLLKKYLSILCKVFRDHPDDDKTVNKDMFFKYLNVCLDTDWFVVCFISYFVKEKLFLYKLMEEHSNWNGGVVTDVLTMIRHQLALLIQLTKFKQRLNEKRFFSIDRKINLITNAIGPYLVTAYSCPLAILSLKYLEVLAKDQSAPIMSLLGLDYDQAQQIFLERLRDPMESEDIKIHILDLIATCIIYQHGITAAVFNLQWSGKWFDGMRHQIKNFDTVTNCIADYLVNINQSLDYLRNPLQVGLLKIMANLWSCGKQSLIDEVVVKDNFWPLLLEPLFQPYDLSPTVYAYIIKIVNIQMFTRPKTEYPAFAKTLEKFFLDNEQVKTFLNYLVTTCGSQTQLKSGQKDFRLIMKNWNELLVIAQQKYPELLENNDLRIMFTEYSLRGLQSLKVDSLGIQSVWIDNALICWSNSTINFNNLPETASNINQFFKIISETYNKFCLRLRSSVLALFYKAFEFLREYYDQNSWALVTILELVGVCVEHEYSVLDDLDWKGLQATSKAGKEVLMPFMLIVNVCSEMITMESVEDLSLWFSYRKYLQRLIMTIPKILSCDGTRQLAKNAMHSLVLYMESPMRIDVLRVNLTMFYDSIEPYVREVLLKTDPKVHPLKLKDIYLALSNLMRFNQAVMKQFQRKILHNCYGFVTMFDHILNYIMRIPEFTVDLQALDLLVTTLCFFDDIMLYGFADWHNRQYNTFHLIMDLVKRVINSCIMLVLQPKSLTFYEVDNDERLTRTEINSEILGKVINRVINVVSLAFKILTKATPDLLVLLNNTQFDISIYLLVEDDFSVPKFDLPINHQLTYGRLLFFAHFLSKTLIGLEISKEPVNTSNSLYEDPSLVLEKGEEDFTRFVGLVEPPDPADTFSLSKFNPFLHMSILEHTGFSDPWIQKLDRQIVYHAFEVMMVFLGAQTYISVTTKLPKTIPLFKRNLCSEIQFLQEYAKKRISELPPGKMDYSKGDMDFISRFMVLQKHDKKFETLCDEYFIVTLWPWFFNICKKSIDTMTMKEKLDRVIEKLSSCTKYKIPYIP